MDIYDVIIIGSGPAGLTSAIYTARSRFKTLILEKAIVGGQVTVTAEVENYPGFVEPINGFLLMNSFENQAKKFGAEIKTGVEVKKIDKKNNLFLIDAGEQVYKSKVLIIATGTKYRNIGIPGEKEFAGRGVSYCATCDGAFFKDQVVAVIGGGNSALDEALFLTKFARKIYLIHRRKEFRADKIYQERVFGNNKIETVLNYIPEAIHGNEKGVEKIVIKEKDSGDIKELNVDGVFVFIGLSPNTEFLNGFVETDKAGYIVTDNEKATNVEGCYAAGDVTIKTLRQIATAVGDGATAANSVKVYLENFEG